MIWLWFTVLFANFAEAVAEGRGKAQADTLRKTRTETRAKRVADAGQHRGLSKASRPRNWKPATSSSASRATSFPATAR